MHLGLKGLDLLLQRHLLLRSPCPPSREEFGLDDDTLVPTGQFKRVVFHVFARPTKDGMQQLLLRSEFYLALGDNLPDQNVAMADTRSLTDNAIFVQVPQGLFTDVGDVSGELFFAQTGFTNLTGKFIDMDAGETVILAETLTDNHRVLKVVTIEGDKSNQNVAAQGQDSVVRTTAVGNHLPRLHLFTERYDGLLVQAGAFVQPHELLEQVDIGVIDLDAQRVHTGHNAGVLGAHDHTGVLTDHLFHTCAHQRGLGPQQGHRLTLHVGTHERPVGIVMLQKRNQRGRDAHNLLGRHIHIAHLVTCHVGQLSFFAGEDQTFLEYFFLRIHGTRRCEDLSHLLIGPQVNHLVCDLALLHLAIGCQQESIFVDLTKYRQGGNETNVRSFRCLNGADPAVVTDVHVPHLETGSPPIQTARAQCGQTPFVRQLTEGIGLVDDLA